LTLKGREAHQFIHSQKDTDVISKVHKQLERKKERNKHCQIMSNSKIQSALLSLVLIGHSQAAFNNPTALINTSRSRVVDTSKIRSGSPQLLPLPLSPSTARTRSQKSWSRLFVSADTKMTTAADVGDDNINGNENKKGSSNINGDGSSSESDSESKNKSYSKLRTLKDRMWVREALEDLTAAEFACSLTANSVVEDKKANNKRAVDFENVLTKLDRRIEDMCVLSTYGQQDSNCIVSYPLIWDGSGEVSAIESEKGKGKGEGKSDSDSKSDSTKKGEECWTLKKELGMGSVTYTDDQRSALVMRLLSSRQNLIKAMDGKVDESGNEDDLDEIREKLQTPDAIEVDDDSNTSSSKAAIGDPSLYVREDGTVDWDGALQDRAALQKFGTSVWARINGQDEATVDETSGTTDDAHKEDEKKVTVKIADTEEILEKKAKLDSLKAELKEMDQTHKVLLNSAVSAGSAVANVNLASLDPELRLKIRDSSSALERKQDEISYQEINYEMERIYTYLDGELGNTSTKGYIPLQDRLNVAEFGLLESQCESLNNQMASEETELDSDVLSVLYDQTVDFKRRLGIDYYVTGLTFDMEAIKLYSLELIEQSKKGLAFYGKGVQLLWNDCVFSTSLITKALQGYTLKPREVRTLRRTLKDMLTFIPCVIILIIPLSPIGHVLVFGAIQRFFPDFFPSCFTERRQNLLSLYESTEFTQVAIKENLQEKLVRILEAAGFFIVDSTKKTFSQATAKEETKEER